MEAYKICLRLIEQKVNFGSSNLWSNKDYENLSELIQEETKILISVSTLRRLWNNEYFRTPQKATLNALAKFIGEKDWMSFLQNEKYILKHEPNFRTNLIKYGLPSLAVLIVLFLSLMLRFYDQSNSRNLDSNEIVSDDGFKNQKTPNSNSKDSSFTLKQPTRKDNSPISNPGWNAIINAKFSKIQLVTESFFYNDSLDISSFLQSNKKIKSSFEGVYYIYDGDFKNAILSSFDISWNFRQVQDYSILDKDYLYFNILSDNEEIRLSINNDISEVQLQIEDTSFKAPILKSLLKAHGLINIRIISQDGELLLIINDRTIISSQQKQISGSIQEISFTSPYPIVISSIFIQDPQQNGHAKYLLR